MLTLETFTDWLAKYAEAWESGNPQAIFELFTVDASYYESPFEEPMKGQDAIFQYWTEGAKLSQKDVHFMSEPVAVSGSTGFARWNASFERVPSGQQVELNGFLEAEFTQDEVICSVFREWWHRRERHHPSEAWQST